MQAVLSARAALTGAAFLFVLSLVGCAGPEAFGGSRTHVIAWAGERGFVAQSLNAGPFELLSLRRLRSGRRLTIYIEGDGAAWLSPYHPPADPTPLRPVALALAAADETASVAYLGRPCQYLDRTALRECSSEYWQRRRFAPEVIHAYLAAIDVIKAAAGAERLILVGYSGGGTIAALLAARREDVDKLVTVAAPLALDAWTLLHGVSKLEGSLDPAAMGKVGTGTMAVHFVGERDKVVPPALVEVYAAIRGERVVRVPDNDHECCWARDWPRLLEELR